MPGFTFVSVALNVNVIGVSMGCGDGRDACTETIRFCAPSDQENAMTPTQRIEEFKVCPFLRRIGRKIFQ
jgi:hypothetical protein